MYEFPKKEKLCNETVIKELFSYGRSFVISPILLVWSFSDNFNDVAIKSIIVVPKKKIRLAVSRNIVKRRLKEAYRKNKINLEDNLKISNKQLNIAIIYQNEEILSYKVIETKIKLILERLKKQL